MIKLSIDKIKNPFKFFLLKLIILFAIVFILDYLIGNILRYFYFNQESGWQYRTTYSIETTKADVLIFGSSRASNNYQPDVFEKRLNLSCYNVGQIGNFIFYDYAVLKGVLKRYSPKIVILDFRDVEFVKDQTSYDVINTLLPYYRNHPEMRTIIELKSPYEKLKLLSSVYPYNSLLFTIVAGNMEFNKKRMVDIKGYIPMTEPFNGSIEFDDSSVKHEIDSTKVKVYGSFIQACINSKVKLYIVCSPFFIKSNHIDYSIALGQQIAKKYNVPFLDYSQDSIFVNNQKLFSDIIHLNDEGAKLFSGLLSERITKP